MFPLAKSVFVAGLATPSECTLCHEFFDEEHIVVQTACGHTFGGPCLLEWAESSEPLANTFPSCKTVLFYRPAPLPKFLPGNQPILTGSNWLENTASPKIAREFVVGVYRRMVFQLAREEQVYESQIDECVNNALHDAMRACDAYSRCNAMFISTENWPRVREVAKEMIQEACDYANADNFDLSNLAEAEKRWVPTIGDVLGWVLKEETDEMDIDGYGSSATESGCDSLSGKEFDKCRDDAYPGCSVGERPFKEGYCSDIKRYELDAN